MFSRYAGKAGPRKRPGWRGGLAVDLAAVADFEDGDVASFVVDFINDAVVALTDAVGGGVVNLNAARRTRVGGQRFDAAQDAKSVSLGNGFHIAGNTGLDNQLVGSGHAESK